MSCGNKQKCKWCSMTRVQIWQHELTEQPRAFDIYERSQQCKYYESCIQHHLFWKMMLEVKYPYDELFQPENIRIIKGYKNQLSSNRILESNMSKDDVIDRDKEAKSCHDLDEDITAKTKKMHKLICQIQDLKDQRNQRIREHNK